MALTEDSVTMFQNPSNNNNSDENRTSKIWGTEGKDRSVFNSNGHGLPGQNEEKTEPQPKRIFRANGKGGHGISFRGQAFDQQTIL